MRYGIPVLGAVCLSVALPLSVAAQAAPVKPADAGHGAAAPIVAHAGAIAWRAGPPSLPPGAEFAILEGNPAEAGPITMRLRFPANYAVPAHWHSAIEHITVLEGTFNVGMGDVLDRSAGTTLTVGGFGVVPAGMRHFAWTGDQPAVLQLHSVGPWDITYVNPADDPRKK